MGVFVLCQVIVVKIVNLYGYVYDVDCEIIIIVGVMQVLLIIVLCCVYLGDEVIVFELMYDSYILLIELVGGKVVLIMLNVLDFCILFDMLVVVIMLCMCLIMFNMLYNLIGMVWYVDDI